MAAKSPTNVPNNSAASLISIRSMLETSASSMSFNNADGDECPIILSIVQTIKDPDTQQKLIADCLRDGLDPNSSNDAGQTALSVASFLGYTKTIVTLLEDEDTNLTAQDGDGDTPLMKGRHDIVKLLLAKAQQTLNVAQLSDYIYQRNNRGETAEKIAISLNHVESFEALQNTIKTLRRISPNLESPPIVTDALAMISFTDYGHEVPADSVAALVDQQQTAINAAARSKRSKSFGARLTSASVSAIRAVSPTSPNRQQRYATSIVDTAAGSDNDWDHSNEKEQLSPTTSSKSNELAVADQTATPSTGTSGQHARSQPSLDRIHGGHTTQELSCERVFETGSEFWRTHLSLNSRRAASGGKEAGTMQFSKSDDALARRTTSDDEASAPTKIGGGSAHTRKYSPQEETASIGSGDRPTGQKYQAHRRSTRGSLSHHLRSMFALRRPFERSISDPDQLAASEADNDVASGLLYQTGLVLIPFAVTAVQRSHRSTEQLKATSKSKDRQLVGEDKKQAGRRPSLETRPPGIAAVTQSSTSTSRVSDTFQTGRRRAADIHLPPIVAAPRMKK